MGAERMERLQRVLEFIEQFSSSFERLYGKLQEEIQIERARNDEYKQNHYLNNLRQTDEKQARDYQRAGKRDKPLEYRRFVEAFKQDVDEELGLIRYENEKGITPKPSA